MKLNMKINKIKSIDKLEIDLPIQKGLYAITGQNGAGKSTVVTCASSVFFNMRMNDYFGATDDDAYIEFDLNGAKRSWHKNEKGKWFSRYFGNMSIKGFYEGSIIFGNRFRNTSYELLKELDRIQDKSLTQSDDFIRKNLGKILHNNEEFYETLLELKSGNIKGKSNFRGSIFYYEKSGKRVSQFHMSTGENLLVSVLDSISRRNSDRASLSKPCIMFLDEIELALHPSSLKRLIYFLREMSDKYNYAIYFSTHSIELISGISPNNIFFIERYSDNTLEILNPCYPAYATRILYDHSGYDHIILVEDDLAKEIISRILRKQSLLNNRLVHVLPCGGYTNVIDLSLEVVNSNLVGKLSKICIILDGDVKEDAQNYVAKLKNASNIPLNFLPIESLEKYLKSKLYDSVDHKLFRKLNDFVFHQKSLNQLVDEYKTIHDPKKDKDGKKFYNLLDDELRNRGKSRSDIVEMIVEYINENDSQSLQKIINFLRKQIT